MSFCSDKRFELIHLRLGQQLFQWSPNVDLLAELLNTPLKLTTEYGLHLLRLGWVDRRFVRWRIHTCLYSLVFNFLGSDCLIYNWRSQRLASVTNIFLDKIVGILVTTLLHCGLMSRRPLLIFPRVLPIVSLYVVALFTLCKSLQCARPYLEELSHGRL